MRNVNETTLILVSVLIGVAGQIALKIGATSSNLATLISGGNVVGYFGRVLSSPTILAGLLLYATSAVLWLMVLTRSELSYAYPFVSLGFLITSLVGWMFLGEAMSVQRASGVLLIVAGVLFVARS